MNTKKSSFYPITSLDKLHNYKQFYLIERDGTVFERVFLNISDVSLREKLIFIHYLKNYVRMFCKEPIGFNVLSRDKPWDFKIELSTKETFNVEITSIADDSSLFEKFKREERLEGKSRNESIPFHELEKLNHMFPNSEIEKLIQEHKNAGVNKEEMISNPYFGDHPYLFLSSDWREKQPLENLIKNAIEGKEAKKHLEKENTVLIIDNRTLIYEMEDLNASATVLEQFYESCTFKEIWFYTGYASDLDGNNAEFSLVPLKISEHQENLLEELAKKNPPNDKGMIIY